jgi:hypothetical protein
MGEQESSLEVFATKDNDAQIRNLCVPDSSVYAVPSVVKSAYSPAAPAGFSKIFGSTAGLI